VSPVELVEQVHFFSASGNSMFTTRPGRGWAGTVVGGRCSLEAGLPLPPEETRTLAEELPTDCLESCQSRRSSREAWFSRESCADPSVHPDVSALWWAYEHSANWARVDRVLVYTVEGETYRARWTFDECAWGSAERVSDDGENAPPDGKSSPAG
jgi:hypothetical protein